MCMCYRVIAYWYEGNPKKKVERTKIAKIFIKAVIFWLIKKKQQHSINQLQIVVKKIIRIAWFGALC